MARDMRALLVGHDIGLMVAYAYADSIPEPDRERYARAYAQPGAVRAGFKWFRNVHCLLEEAPELVVPVLAGYVH